MPKIKFNKDYYYYIILGLIFFIAIFLRTKVYFLNRPLWHDECSLAMSIIRRGILGYFNSLEHSQVAPVGFVMLSKIFSIFMGTKEYILRIVPYICGIVSIPTFYIFQNYFLTKKWSIIIANLLFGINLQLIYYSQEFKPYQSDVLIFMLLFIFAIHISIQNLSKVKTFFLGLTIGIISLFSFPSLFIIGALIAYNLYSSFSKHIYIKKTILFFIPMITIISLYYLSVKISLQAPGMNTLYQDFYSHQGFLNLNINSLLKLIPLNLSYYFIPNKFVLLQLILIITGLYYVINQAKIKQNTMLLFCLFFILSASFLHIYPIMQRVSLYLVPILIVLFIIPLDNISIKRKCYSAIICLLTFLSIFQYNLNYFKNIINNTALEHNDPKNTMKILSERISVNDYIIVNNASDSEWYYYSDYFNLKTKKYFVLIVPTPNKTEYIKALNMLPKGNSYWFYFVNDYSHSPVIPFLKEWKTDKTIIYEYENKNSYLLYLKNIPNN